VAPVPLRLRRSAPSKERQEVLRLHMPQVGLGWPHKNAGEDTPARPSCLRPHATNVPKSVNLFCAWDAPFCEPGLGRLGSVVSRRPRQTQGNAVAPAQVDRRQSDQMALAGVRGGQRLPRSSLPCGLPKNRECRGMVLWGRERSQVRDEQARHLRASPSRVPRACAFRGNARK